jgi:hypothetical protein
MRIALATMAALFMMVAMFSGCSSFESAEDVADQIKAPAKKHQNRR